jgi:hypothetical protein
MATTAISTHKIYNTLQTSTQGKGDLNKWTVVANNNLILSLGRHSSTQIITDPFNPPTASKNT